MAKTDGGLRGIFTSHLVAFHWVAIESWSTGHGIPDGEFCAPGGHQAWIEFKKTNAWAIRFKPGQIAWHERRARIGGRSFIAVRRRKVGTDELWLFPGAVVRSLLVGGLRSNEAAPLGKWIGGPSRWDWPMVRDLLTR